MLSRSQVRVFGREWTIAAVRDGAAVLVPGLAALALLLFVAYPLLWLVFGTLGAPRELSAKYFVLVAQSGLLLPLANTIELAISVGFASVALGVPIAWIMARTDLPLRLVFHALIALTFIIPPYLTALAYVALMGPNAGHFNHLMMWLFHLDRGPFDIFSWPGIIFVIALHGFTIPYFLTYTALRSLDTSLEESARILGASRWQVTRRVTLPLVAPAITAGALLAAVDSMALFGPQAYLGLPAQIVYLPTRIYAVLTTYPPRFAEASILSLFIVVLTILGLFGQRRYLEQRSFVTIGGRSAQAERLSFGMLRWPLLAGCIGVVFLSAVAPVGVLLVAAFSKSWVAPLTWDNATFANFHVALVEYQVSVRGIANSLKLAAGAATLATAIGLLVAYMDQRGTVRWRVLDYLAILPLGLPGTVMAVALLLAFIRPPLRLYGTIWILLVAYVARVIPLATRTANAGLQQLDPSLEEIARVSGASWIQGVRLILLPLLRSHLVLTWLLVFISAVGELSASILLYTTGTETMSVAMFHLNEAGQLEPVAALSITMFGIILAAALAIQWIAGRPAVWGIGEFAT
jgi:iron(III) transport system permease protein